MFLDFLSRLRVFHFFVLLVAINLVAAALQFFFPAAESTLIISLLVHLSQAVVLVWFLVKIVRPVRSGFDELSSLTPMAASPTAGCGSIGNRRATSRRLLSSFSPAPIIL